MKKISFILSTLILSVCFAQEGTWKDDWLTAVNFCNDKDYENADLFFSQAIKMIESNGDVDHPHVYVDRGRLYLLLERYDEALADLDKAMECKNLSEVERRRALVSRIATKSHLKMDHGVLSDLNLFGESYAPIVEHTKNKVYIRNVPDCECFRNILTCYFIHSGFCGSKNNVHMMKSGICIVDKDCNDGEVVNESESQVERICDACGQTLGAITSPQCVVIDGCTSWCDANTIIATAWCSKVFKAPHCQAACYAAVYVIQKGCYWCCEGGNIYQKCLKPFERIVDYMQAPCDPYWD